MTRDIRVIGNCPRCASGGLTCRHNHFERDDLRIISWEHRCANCGYRETRAFRSDDPPSNEPEAEDPNFCPYCSRPAGDSSVPA